MMISVLSVAAEGPARGCTAAAAGDVQSTFAVASTVTVGVEVGCGALSRRVLLLCTPSAVDETPASAMGASAAERSIWLMTCNAYKRNISRLEQDGEPWCVRECVSNGTDTRRGGHKRGATSQQTAF